MLASARRRMQGKALPGFLGYLWSKAAMHPSVCALRRIHRPVCGARIARRALKHACALRPSNLLRLAFSAAGGARLRSPLQGRLCKRLPPKRLPCKGSWRRQPTEGCRAWLCQYPSGSPEACPALRHYRASRCGAYTKPQCPPFATLPGGRERPPYIARQSCGGHRERQAW